MNKVIRSISVSPQVDALINRMRKEDELFNLSGTVNKILREYLEKKLGLEIGTGKMKTMEETK